MDDPRGTPRWVSGKEAPMAPETWKFWKPVETRLGAACDASCRLVERATVERATAVIVTTRVR